jgi:trk system potassium uptake protein TrkH
MIKRWLVTQNRDSKSIGLLLVKGYFTLIIICFIGLLMPFFQNTPTSLIDHIFFSVSVVSTTGLAPTNFAESYNLGGQIFCLIFIQLGGIGYMALSSFIIIKSFKKLPNISAGLLRFEFNLPQRYPLLAFIYSVIIFTILIEFIGAIALYYGFKSAGVEDALWPAIFHSISAFCTAGFSLQSDSIVSFADNRLITNTIVILSLLGSIGFIVLLDIFLKLMRKRKSITLTTKIILYSSTFIWLLAAIAIYFSDTQLLSLGWQGFKHALFQVLILTI